MTSFERRVVKIWFWVGALAAVAMLFSSLLAMLILLFLPAWLLLLAIRALPTLFLYLTAAIALHAAGRLLLRRTRIPPAAIALVAAAIVVGTGIAVPVLANRSVDREVARLMADDIGTEPLIEPVGTVAILDDPVPGWPHERCHDECQRLLFSGLARSVLQGGLAALADPARSPVPLMRHSIVPVARGCDDHLLAPAVANRAEWHGPPPPPRLWEALGVLARRGLCFRSDPTRDARADLYLVSNRNFATRRRDQPDFDASLAPIQPLRRREILRRQGSRLVPVMRRTELSYSRLAVPLRITPPFSFDTYEPGHWTYGSTRRRGRAPTYDGMMRHWLRNDVRLSGLGGPEIVARRPRARTGAD